MKVAFILVVVFHVFAYADQIEEIRALYSEVLADLEDSTFYRTTIRINADDASYPAVGIYFENIDFYWEIDIEFSFEPSVRFVRINSQYSAIEEYHEFLFYDTGELAFVYRKAGIMQEVERFYFNRAGELIRFIREDEVFELPDRDLNDLTEEVLKRGTNLAESFSLIH